MAEHQPTGNPAWLADRRRALLLGVAITLVPCQAMAQSAAAPQSNPAATDSVPATSAAPAGEVDQQTTVDTIVQTPPANPTATDIIVTGIRATQRNSLQVKRNSDVIVDAIVSDEIGATPDQSVGETLERIVGVSGDRFKGSSSEISIRGLGPFLGFSTLNGREVTSGSGDRSVSFQQFPSELVNGVLVYKSQSADLVEGGTSGIIDLRTLRPLDFGKRRVQLDARGIYEPYDAKVDGHNGIGYRVSGSVVDQFKVGDGDLGVSLGFERTDQAAPEDFYTESSSVRPCNSTGPANSNCSYSATSGNPFYFASNNYLFRQSNNDSKRTAVIGTVQYKPRPELNINLDGQFSRRTFQEDRSDLVVAEGARGIVPVAIGDNGTLDAWSGNSRLESQTRIRARDEDYYGGGLSVEWKDEAAYVGFDASYSETQRDQVDYQTRLRTSSAIGYPLSGRASVPSGFSSGRVPYAFDKRSGMPVLTFDPRFDVNNHDYFNDAAYARRDAEYRNDNILAFRLDGEAFIADSFLKSIKLGLRYSDHHRVADLSNDNDVESFSEAQEQAANAACRIGFRERDFLGDSSSNIRSWAEFDPQCMFDTLRPGGDPGRIADARSPDDIDVTEKIMAAYAMAKFGDSTGRLGGNIGVRFINTNVRAFGYRAGLIVTNNAGVFTVTPDFANLESLTIKNDFTDVLPSFNAKYEVAPNFLVRGAVYRALSRPNIEDMGAGRQFASQAQSATTIADATQIVSAGNPRLLPLKSWNGDLSFEYYPTADNAITLALFYKQLQAGIVPASANALIETFLINGVPTPIPVPQQTNDNSKRDLYGLEVSVSQQFSFLPGILNGFGFIGGYSYANTNFEYPDPSAVDANNPLANFTDPAEIIGLSRHTFNAQLYYEKGPVQLRALYKYRSRYLKPFLLNANRFAQPQDTLDASAQFKLTRNLTLRFEALNILNSPQILERPVPGAISEVSYYGSTYYAGFRVRF